MEEKTLDEIHADFDAWWARGEADLKRRKKEKWQNRFKHLKRRLHLFVLELLKILNYFIVPLLGMLISILTNPLKDAEDLLLRICLAELFWLIYLLGKMLGRKQC